MNNEYLSKAKEFISDPQVLSVVAAKRAKQLATGARPMVKCDSSNLLDVALLEIGMGLLSYEIGEPKAAEAAVEEAAEAVAEEKNEEE